MANYYFYPPTAEPQFYNYYLLSSIYQNIINTFNQYQSKYNLNVKTKTNKDIMEKLEKIKSLEREISTSLVNDELKKKLQIASVGIIDPDRIPDEALPALLEKHSNLLGLTSNYNRNVKELADTLYKINDVLIKKSSPMYFPVQAPIIFN